VTSDAVPTYPIQLRIAGWRALVVGAGEVAARKVDRLLDSRARVTVVAPQATAAVASEADAGRLRWERRRYRGGEAAAYRLVFAATDDGELNRRIAEDADRAGALVNVADDPLGGSFYLPAQIRRGRLQLNIATEGGAPFVARRLREAWSRRLGPEWSAWLADAERFRTAVLAATDEPAARARLFDRYCAVTLPEGRDTVDLCPEPTWRAWLEEIR
jgi:precorrin-2 dehydrogenase/sirohydrochlorin ferrochelatase